MAHTIIHHFFLALRTLLVNLILLLLWGGVVLIGFFFWSEFIPPWNWVLGLPLALLGVSMVIANLYELVVSVISWRWGRMHCPFCPPVEDVEEILSPKDGFKE